jgi:hypothetical protein
MAEILTCDQLGQVDFTASQHDLGIFLEQVHIYIPCLRCLVLALCLRDTLQYHLAPYIELHHGPLLHFVA